MSLPLLSVAMPVHCGEAWIEAALASIPTAAAGEVEVIIRDSTPDRSCASLVERHVDRLKIDYAYMPDVASWTRKTNLAIEAARAPYVCTLHQDDVWLDGRLPLAKKLIARFPDASLFLTPAFIINTAGRRVGKWHPPFRAGRIEPKVYRDRLIVQNSIAMPAPIFRRDAYIAAGGLDESLWYTPDWDLWLKLGEYGSVVYDGQPVTAFRVHDRSLTMRGDRKELAGQLEVVLLRYLGADSRTARLSYASAHINMLLAEAAMGNWHAMGRALATFLALGPLDGARYIRYSRIIERVLPRIRMRIAGGL